MEDTSINTHTKNPNFSIGQKSNNPKSEFKQVSSRIEIVEL